MDRAELKPRVTAFPPTGRRFFKYDALGNDYIVLDPADWPEPPAVDAIRRICDRHRGVGSDGILWGPLAPLAPPLQVEGGFGIDDRSRGIPRTSPEPVEGGVLRQAQDPRLECELDTQFALRLFNPDGSEFEKSGNGLRIFAALPVGPRPTGRPGV